jgi:hypothetical protein
MRKSQFMKVVPVNTEDLEREMTDAPGRLKRILISSGEDLLPFSLFLAKENLLQPIKAGTESRNLSTI